MQETRRLLLLLPKTNHWQQILPLLLPMEIILFEPQRRREYRAFL